MTCASSRAVRVRRRAALTLAALTSFGLASCAPGPELATTTVELALDFSADSVLEVSVYDGAVAVCADLLGDVGGREPLAVSSAVAQNLNAGGDVSLSFPELPAEVPLTFYATATEAGTLLAEDCDDAVIVPANGTVEVRLVVAAP